MPLFPSNVKHTQITLAGNRVMVKIPSVPTASLAGNSRSKLIYKVSVYIQEQKGSSVFILAGVKTAHEAAARTKNGVTYLDGASFDISDILQANIPESVYNLDQYVTTTYTYSAPNEFLGTLKYYYTTEITTLATVPVQSSIFTAINGRLSKRKFASWKNTFFTARMDDIANFLTWAPTTTTNNRKYVTKTQNEYLFWLQNYQPSPTSLELRIQITFKMAGGNLITVSPESFTYPILSPSFEKIHTIPCGYTQLNIEYLFLNKIPSTIGLSATSTVADIVGWQVKVRDNTVPIPNASEERFFILKPAQKYTSRPITFRNSLGTYDTLAFDGHAIESAKVTRSTVDKVIKDDGLPTIAELKTVAVDGIHEISLNTGYMVGYDANYLLELLYSDDIRLQTDEGLVPITLVTDSIVHADEMEFLKQRTFQFKFANTEIAGTFLGVAPSVDARPTIWEGIEPFCLINDNGLYAGQMKFASLELHYSDGALEPVLGAQKKGNIEGTAGYIAPISSPLCLAAATPFQNTVQSRLGTYRKNTCIAPQIGDYPTITIAAGTYGGATQAQANQRALDAITALDTQAYANTGAGAAACITGPWAYALAGIPSGKFNLRWGQRVQGNMTAIQGGPGAASGLAADANYGNSWQVYASTNASSIYYDPNLFDNALPIAPGAPYLLDVFTNTPKSVTIYKNGVSVLTNSITSGDIAGTGYKRINLSALTFATADKYYIDIT